MEKLFRSLRRLLTQPCSFCVHAWKVLIILSFAGAIFFLIVLFVNIPPIIEGPFSAVVLYGALLVGVPIVAISYLIVKIVQKRKRK